MNESLVSLQTENALAAGRAAPSIPRGMNMEQARHVAEDFESFFLSQMLQPMFAGIDADEPFGGGQAEEMWRSLQLDEMGKSFARQGGVGIADMVLREMIKLQEGQ